ncbi:MAG: 2-dehydropantoate 2-reductase [Candidatus Thermoplasmatota archaeon]
MNIGIVGPGAMGTFLSGLLAQKNEVTLLGRRDEDIERIEIKGETELVSEIDFTTDPHELASADLVVISTKAFDTEEAVKSIVSHLTSDCSVLSLQNGLINEEIIADFVGEERTVGGITSHGVTYLETGKVRHAGKGETIIGPYPKGNLEKNGVKKTVEVLKDAGLKTEVSDNIIGHIWKKVIVNAGINPVTALLGVKNGFLVEDENLLEVMREVVDEATEVARKHTELPVDDTFKETREVAEATRDNRSSMLQDIENERRTEIDHINGAVIQKAEKAGVSVPVNTILYRLIKSMEKAKSVS